jgi:glycosyltransferase involved in cell wall biosynthesis
VLLAGNTSWYLWNFRRDLIGALVAHGMEVAVVAPRDDYSERLAASPGVRWFDWPLALNDASPAQELTSLWRYLRIARQVRPDFVVNHGIKANVYGGLACRLLGIPYANSVTGLGMTVTTLGWGPRLLGKLYAFACNRARVLFIQNYDDRNALRRFGLSESVKIVRTMGSGVDLEHFAFAGMPQREGRIFLFVGRLQRDKGIWDFVDAARAVRAEFPSARFVALGSQTFANRGAVSDEVLEGWKREGLVEFVGHHDDVRPWLVQAHALVLPSHGGEGVPRVILEAAATGRPSIASDVPGCRDAVRPGGTGFLVPAQDVRALADAMRRVCTASTQDLASMGRAAREDAQARFSVEGLIAATLAAVQKP